MPRPVSITRGKVRPGSSTSSTMLTESSKPTMAKNATVVAMVMAAKTFFSPGDSKTTTRPTSPSVAIAQKPIAMMTPSASTTTEVSTTLKRTLSPTPRRLTSASSTMKPRATSSVAVSPVGTPPTRPSRPSSRLEATRPEDVEALVMPEQTTAKATMKVRKCTLKALCTKSAAPAACGCLVTSSR